MTLTGTLLRILGAAILLIAVQFASVAAKAHVGHSHGPDGHSIHCQRRGGRRRPYGCLRRDRVCESGRASPTSHASSVFRSSPACRSGWGRRSKRRGRTFRFRCLPDGLLRNRHGLLRSCARGGFVQPAPQGGLAPHRLCPPHFRSGSGPPRPAQTPSISRLSNDIAAVRPRKAIRAMKLLLS